MYRTEAPTINAEMSSSWMQAAGPSFNTPKFLEKCFQDWNTIQIPILGNDEFVKVAIRCAHEAGEAGTRKEFLRLLEVAMGSELQKLSSQLTGAAAESISLNHRLPKGFSNDMCEALSRLCRQPNLKAVMGIVETASGVAEEDAQTTGSAGGNDAQDGSDTGSDSDYGETQIDATACLPIPSDHADAGRHLDSQTSLTESDSWRLDEESETEHKQSSNKEELVEGDDETDITGASIPLCCTLPSPSQDSFENAASESGPFSRARPSTPKYEGRPNEKGTSIAMSPPASSCSDLSAKGSSSQSTEARRKRKYNPSDDEDGEEEDGECSPKRRK